MSALYFEIKNYQQKYSPFHQKFIGVRITKRSPMYSLFFFIAFNASSFVANSAMASPFGRLSFLERRIFTKEHTASGWNQSWISASLAPVFTFRKNSNDIL